MRRLFLFLWLLLIPTLCFSGQRYIKFDAQTGGWTATNTIAGATSGATAIIKAIRDDGTTGILELIQVSGIFQEDEIIYESAVGGELLANNDFETYVGTQDDGNSDTFTSWYIQGIDATHTLEATATVQTGANAVKIVKADVSASPKISKYSFAETNMGGKYVRLSCYVKTDGASRLHINLYDRTNAGYPLQIYSGYQTSYIEEVSYVFVPAGCVLLEVSFNISEVTGIVHFDNSSLKEVTNAALVNGTPYGGGRTSW